MDHIIRHSYTASTDGQSVEALLRSQGYSKSLINRIKLTEDGLMIRGAKVYTTFRMKAGERLDVTFAGRGFFGKYCSCAHAAVYSLRR